MVAVEALRGLSVFQVAFVVEDFDAALRRFENVLAPGPWRCFRFGSSVHAEVEYRGAPAEFETLLALNGSDPQFELIQPVSGSGAHREWLDEHGESFHHVGMIVPDLQAASAQMTEAGYDTIQAGRGIGPERDGAYAYFDTTADLGFVVELVDPPTAMPEPYRVWP